MCSWSLFFANISHFLSASIKLSCYSQSNEIGLPPLFFLSLALAHSLLSTLMSTLTELSRKKKSALLLLFFISKSPGGYGPLLLVTFSKSNPL